MDEPNSTASLSAVLVTLYKGVLYHDEKPELWQALLKLEGKVRDQVALLGRGARDVG
jgi:hypothetical protein